jgi:photosystem II stability/assembly factor-like uncharacterized protein
MIKNVILAFALLIALKSTVYAQWTQVPNFAQNVISVYVANNNLLVGTATGVYYTANNGSSWNTASGINTTAKSFTKDGNKLLVASYEKLYQSTTGGVSWSAMPSIYTFQDANNVVVSGGNYVVGMNGSGIWTSANNGTSWSAISSWQSRNTDLVIKKNKMFASYQSSGYLQVSDNNGQTWYSVGGNGITVGSSISYQDIYALGVKNDSILIAGTKNFGQFTSYDGIYFSYDDGDNWTKKINGLTTRATNTIAVVGNVIFAGTEGGGVFYSINEGNNWIALNGGLSNLTINKLYASGSTLYAGVPTGVFKIDITAIIPTNTSNNLLSDNFLKLYPNPSNGAVSFECTTPNFSEPLELLIYNGTGSLIKTISLANNHAPLLVADWEAGMYYAALRSKTSISLPQKFVVVK